MSDTIEPIELVKLGETASPEVLDIVAELEMASKLVEADGASYAHMPSYFLAIGKLIAFVEEEKRKAVAEFAESLGLRHKYESIKE